MKFEYNNYNQTFVASRILNLNNLWSANGDYSYFGGNILTVHREISEGLVYILEQLKYTDREDIE